NQTIPNIETTANVSKQTALTPTSEVEPLQQAANQTFNPTVPNIETTTPVSEQTALSPTSEVEPLQQATNQNSNTTRPNIETTAPVPVQPTSPKTIDVEPLQPAKRDFDRIATPFNVSQDDATKGQLTQLKVDNNQPKAASDTVPAMLRPEKFAINKADTQKNLNLLEHLNKGGTEENIVQRKTTTQNNYSSPPLIFKKSNSTNKLSDNNSDTPSQWSSIENLLNISNDDSSFTNFSSETESVYNSQKSNKYFPIQQKTAYSHKAIDDNQDKTLPSDISTDIKPFTETIKNSFDDSANSNNSNLANSKEDDEIALEALAREVYTRLRQQLEIEKERQGTFTGRLPW
ncbi:hypothetical protein, partial [Nostoc sp.]|uniref:hypothetical protein n=1 Tax=Nostoc sp. TaxID=1180 RepID=UPI002FF83941